MNFLLKARLCGGLVTVVLLTLAAKGAAELAPIPFADSAWHCRQGTITATVSARDGRDAVTAELAFPGNALVWQEVARNVLRPNREKFRRRFLRMEIMAEGLDTAGVRGVFFVKDKDGFWFQTPEPFELHPGQWQTVGADLTVGNGELIPVGHTAAWNSLFAADLQSAGVSLFGRRPGRFKLHCRPVRFEGELKPPPLAVDFWQLPDAAIKNQRFESRFRLSRTYFNPFDPDDIAVDVEVLGPDGKTARWPAFYSQDYTRDLFCNRERNLPRGEPFWAFRLTPPTPGIYRFRLVVRDRSEREAADLTTPWRSVTVADSKLPGFVRVSRRDPVYFEFTDGSWFYPVGMNLHTNIDVRSETAFGYGHIPDHGTFDYDMYFARMQQHRMNVAEIWMASWTYAVEWSASCQNYYGLGRYSLANAWRLDRVLDAAERHGIYVHLVLDNHGKMSAHSDQEWSESPLNRAHPFVVANGGFLAAAVEYFSSAEADRYRRDRDRYLAARWGAFTGIMGIELWSEGNLVTDFEQIYNNNVIVDWTSRAAAGFRAADSGRHPVTTHFCGDYNNNLHYRKLEDLPVIDYIVGDAYRNIHIPFYQHMAFHRYMMQTFAKPVWITEFGGTSGGGDDPVLEADIKTALWSALPLRQAGVPMTWWHDFVDRRNLYSLYRAFQNYRRGIDPRGKNFTYLDCAVIPAVQLNSGLRRPGAGAFADRINRLAPGLRCYFWSRLADTGSRWQWLEDEVDSPVRLDPAVNFFNPDYPEYPWHAFVAGNGNEVYGWVFLRPAMRRADPDHAALPPTRNLLLPLDFPLHDGDYQLLFYDTDTGKEFGGELLTVDTRNLTVIRLPPFATDVAFKLLRRLPPGPYRPVVANPPEVTP